MLNGTGKRVSSYEELLGIADAYTDSRTLIAGVELDVFTHIGDRPLTAGEVARRARASAGGVEVLLNALVGMGILEKRGERFCNTRLSRTYLDATSPTSVTNFLWLAGQHWEEWKGLTAAIRRGRRGQPRNAPDDPAFRKRFAKALHERSLFLAPKVVRPLRLDGAKTLLDLGGGAGSYALALLKRTPGLHATIFDRLPTVKVALAEARKAGLAKRVGVIGGDLFTHDYGGPYDVVFYSNVIHIYGPQENVRILKKIKNALRPGGRLLIVEYFLDPDRAHPADVSSFALMMYLVTQTGQCYTWDEVISWLTPLGFSRFRRTLVTEKIGILDAS
jgi:SAM-dependent methyltransferase